MPWYPTRPAPPGQLVLPPPGWRPEPAPEEFRVERPPGWWAVIALDTAMTVRWVSEMDLEFIKAVGFEVLTLEATAGLALQKIGMLQLARGIVAETELTMRSVFMVGLELNAILHASFAVQRVGVASFSQALNLSRVVELGNIKTIDLPEALSVGRSLGLALSQPASFPQTVTAGRSLSLGIYQSVAFSQAITATRGLAFGFPPTAEVTDTYTGPSNTSGTNFTHTIRRWANFLDLVALGGGGSGQASAAYFNYGAPGNPGQWATYTASRGPTNDLNSAQIAWTETQITGTTGNGAPAAAGPSTLPGSSGGDTTIVLAIGTLTGNGGSGGLGWASSSNYGPGPSPNTLTYNTKNYPGGADNTTRAAGKPPGGAGSGSGGFSSSYAGARGGAWIRSYQ